MAYCHADEVAAKVSEQLGYPLVGDAAIVREASAQFGVVEERLARTLSGQASLLDRLGDSRPENAACLRAALAKRVATDDIVYLGAAMHLIPKSITHALRVCIVAEQDYKIQVAMEKEKVSERKARSLVKADNNGQLEWVRWLFDCGPWVKKLYDIVIPMARHSVETAAALICENASKEAVATTARSQAAVDDFKLAADVSLQMVKKWPDVDVQCDGGEVTLLINKYAVRLERLKKELTEAASAIPGVKGATARPGPKYEMPSLHRDIDLGLPSKILLVDDEKEFVETLSERLVARKMEPSIAYNGEEALSHVASDEPEVMVLDLKMPGIDGMEVLRRVRQERPNVEVIILTGHGSEQDRVLAEELGAFAYLEKPVDIDVLTKTMQAAYKKIRDSEADDA